MKKAFIIFVLFFTGLSALSAHPGRLDKNGGHNGPNGYHYHNQSGGGSSAPKTNSANNNAPSADDVQNGKVLIDTDNYDDALKKLLDFADAAVKELPCFQTSGFGEYLNKRNKNRYGVFVTARDKSIKVLFSDDLLKRDIEIYLARDERSLPLKTEKYLSPINSARELVGKWFADKYK